MNLALAIQEAKRRGLPIPTDEKDNHELNLLEWLEEVTPEYTWRWKYLLYILEHLKKITNGEIDKLMIFLPPRHTKSETVTIRYPVFRLEKDPTLRVIIGSYSDDLAKKFGRSTRRIARRRLKLSKWLASAGEWETEIGGGIKSVGVGAGITGRGANLIIIDDPIKNRAEAESKAYRDRVYDWYTNDIMTRLEPDGAIIIIQTRWHEDDLAGRILNSEDGKNWTVINLPAEAEENDPLGREIGEALCPERYNKETLAKIKIVLGIDYHALYQQSPQPREGRMFKRDWFEIVEAIPAGMTFVRYWDKAGTEDGGDFTSGCLMGMKDEIYYIIDIVRGQWEYGEREKVIKQTAALDALRFGKGVRIWVEEEGGSGGKESAQRTIKKLAGYIVQSERPTGSKEVRASSMAAQAYAGNVKLFKGDWNAEFITEICKFPTGKNDDQVDSASGAFNKLALGGGWSRGMG